MAVRVLGALDVGADAISPRERAMLAALIVRRGTTVTPAELAEAWWGESLPPTWAQQVRNSVARIRARLGRDAVETVGADYRLGLDHESIDAVRFERLVSDARAHAVRGAHDQAADAYRRALALWRGTPLAEVASWPPGASEALRLDEIRASAEEELLEERLRAGDHRAVIPEAERLVRGDPLREDRWAILALANYQSERQAEALAVIRAARRRLDEELGIEPGARLTDLETAILRHDPALAAPSTEADAGADCPYRGLAAFEPEDAGVFFGRDADIEAVTERVRPGAIVVIAGPSGSGKSSLLRAGVMPRLRDAGRDVSVLTPHHAGVEGLRAAFTRDAGAGIVCVDQAEELIGRPEQETDDVMRLGEAWLARGGAVVLAIRSDFLDRATALPHIGAALGRGVYALAPMGSVGLRAAIERPAHGVGLHLEPGLVEVLLRDAGDRPGILPALSHALVATWARRAGATLTVEGYEESGGIAGAIAQSAEGLYQRLGVDDQVVCRSLMMRLLELSPDGATIRRPVPLASLTADPARRRVIEALVETRLVSIDGDTAMLAHEAVGTAWPRLDAWLTDDVQDTRMLRKLETAAEAWVGGGRADDELLRGAGLHAALEWREASGPDLTEIEASFLDASAQHADAEARRLALRAQRDRRQNRRLRWALGAVATLLLVALTAGGVAIVQGREASAASEGARIEALVATSLSLRSTDRDVASLLAAEAYRRWPEDARVRSALWGAMTSADGLVRKWTFDGARVAAAPIPGTDTALVVTDSSDASEMFILDLMTGARERSVAVDLPSKAPVDWRNLAVSPDGSTAAVQTPRLRVPGDEGTCCVHDLLFVDLTDDTVLSGSGVFTLRTTQHIFFTPDASAAMIGNFVTGDLMSIDMRTGVVTPSSPGALTDHTGEQGLTNAITEAGPGRIAIGADTTVTVYDSANLSTVARYPIDRDRVGTALAHDVTTIVTAGPDGLARIDEASGALIWETALPQGGVCWQLRIDAPRDVVYCSQRGAVTKLSLATGAPVGAPFLTQADDAAVVTLRADGSELLLTDRSSILLRRVDGSGPVGRAVAAGRALADGFDADGAVVITSSDDHTEKQLWDVETDAPLGTPAELLAWASRGRVLRAETRGAIPVLSGGAADTRLDADLVALAGEIDGVLTAFPGDTAFLIAEAGLLPIDPETGEGVGAALLPGLPGDVQTISESADASTAAVTWWNALEGRTQTTVLDRTTGDVIADGLFGAEGSLMTAENELLAVSDTLLARHDLTTLAPLTTLPKPYGGGQLLELDDDRETLLVVGRDNRASLYDFGAGIRLGDSMDTVAPDVAGGAHLSPDGDRLVTGSAEGLLVWELDPRAHAEAACLIAGRELVAAEWSTYFGDEPQTPTCAEHLR